MKVFLLDLKVITIGLLYVSTGLGLQEGLPTGSEEAKSNEPLSKSLLDHNALFIDNIDKIAFKSCV